MFKEAHAVYINVLDMIDSYDKYDYIKKNIVEKLGEIYYMNESIINLSELSKLYFNLGDEYLKKFWIYLC